MAIEIKVPKEIKEYKSRSYFGFSLRQFICISITLVINVPLYFFISKYVSKELASWMVIFIAAPMALIGFFNYGGLPFEKFMVAFFKTKIIYPQKRIYKTENFYESILSNVRKDENSDEVFKHNKKRKNTKK